MHRFFSYMGSVLCPPIRTRTTPAYIDSAETYKRAHDHISNSINISFKALVAVFFYCCLTIFLDFGAMASDRIKIPIAAIETSYTGFSVVSLGLICILVASLHAKLAYWRALGGATGCFSTLPLPFFFNNDSNSGSVLRNLSFYWLPILVIVSFMANVVFGQHGEFWGTHPLRNIFILYIVGPISICVLLYLQIYYSTHFFRNFRMILWVPIVLFAYFPLDFLVELLHVALDANSYYDWN